MTQVMGAGIQDIQRVDILQLRDDKTIQVDTPTPGTYVDALFFTTVDNQVNYLKMVGSATGNSVALESTGDDTDISLAFLAKGAGIIELNSQVQFNSARKANIATVNAATYDILDSDEILHVTYTGSGAVTSLTLMSAEVSAGRVITIKDAGGNAGTNNITIDTEGAETIDGAATATINVNYDSLNIYSDGSNWFIY